MKEKMLLSGAISALFAIWLFFSSLSFNNLDHHSEKDIIGGQSPQKILKRECTSCEDCPKCKEYAKGTCYPIATIKLKGLPITITICASSIFQPPGAGIWGCESQKKRWRCQFLWGNDFKWCWNNKVAECGRKVKPQCIPVKEGECQPGPCGVIPLSACWCCKL